MTDQDQNERNEQGQATEGGGGGRRDGRGGMAVPATLPILSLRGTVVFPQTVIPLAAGQARSLRLIDEVMAGDRLVGLFMQKDAEQPGDDVKPGDTHEYGAMGVIHQMMRVPDGTVRLVIQGLERITLGEFAQEEPFLKAAVMAAPETVDDTLEVQALTRNSLDLFGRMVALAPNLADDLLTVAINIEEPRHLVYFIASNLRQLDPEQKQALLEIDAIKAKLEEINGHMGRELEVLELGRKLQSNVQEELGKSQREYFLREQLKAIQKELGESNEQEAEISEYRRKLDEANLPEEADKEARRELERLAKLPPAAAEYGVIKTYLDWLVSLPWNVSTEGEIDVPKTRQVLDDDHFGLEKPKDRILEYLAVRKLKKDRGADAAELNREPILCFVGPPGVGKTSLAQSIAKAQGRHLTRMSLGGVRDESEIRGHRRTYIGAMPGRIIQALRRAGSNDPVFVLDEVDKLGTDWRGDPSSALLEVLDPEQNNTFRDHYLDVAFDLSKVMFICTANQLDTIPGPLRDRMEIIQLSGYTDEEKRQIAEHYLVPKQEKANGLTEDELTWGDDAITEIISGYTREAGVRWLEREIGAVCRKAATAIASGKGSPGEVTPQLVREYLGRRRFYYEDIATRTAVPGVATGMVVTSVGGDLTFIEATRVPGKGQLIVTGQLGDVMKESTQAALSYVRSRAEALGIDPQFLKESDIHIHVPAGAVPKDGPSAGVTMATALVSLLTGTPINEDVAMTGEITLRGQVLPIGGLKEKSLAAYRAGLRTIVFPARNEGDLDDLPTAMRQEVTWVPATTMDDVLAAALPSVGERLQGGVPGGLGPGRERTPLAAAGR